MAEKTSSNESRKLFKSRKDKMIDGVCAGVADYFHGDVTLVRILWIISAFLDGIGIIAYILAMILVPVNPDHQNLSEDEKKKTNPALLWGVGLILLGIFFLSKQWHWMHGFPHDFFRWWHIPWDWWPVALIVLGALYIIHIITRDKEKSDVQTDENKVKRSESNKVVGGVCGGLGEHYHIDPVLLRIAFVVVALMTHVFAWVVIYLAMMILIPKADDER